MVIKDNREVKNKILRSAVIGTGLISEQHLRFLKNQPGVQLANVCDLSQISAKFAAAQFDAEKYSTDFLEMLREENLDVVHVLTPPKTHKKIVSECLRAGVHVICEKPVTLSRDDLIELLDLAKKNQVCLVENHNYAFNPPILRMRNDIQNGLIGEVEDIEIRMQLNIRSEGGRYADENLIHPSHQLPAGVLHEFISHLCYLGLRLLPNTEDPVRVLHASWSNHGKVIGDNDIFKYDDLDALLVKKRTHVRLRFSTYAQPDCFSVIVRGDGGYLETDLFHPFYKKVFPRLGQLSPMANQYINGMRLSMSSFGNLKDKIMQKTAYEGLNCFLEQTYKAFWDKADFPVTEEDMFETCDLIESLLAGETQA